MVTFIRYDCGHTEVDRDDGNNYSTSTHGGNLCKKCESLYNKTRHILDEAGEKTKKLNPFKKMKK